MITDLLGRPLKNLRLSVTDRCNLRCSYCMPEAEYVWLPRNDILNFEEMSTLVDIFAQAGVDRIRLTGGEPLLRRDLSELVRMLADKPAIRDLALTTNGVALADQARALHEAGLHRLTVSLDTLQPDRFQALTRFNYLPQVLAGIDAALTYFAGIKIDSLVPLGPAFLLKVRHPPKDFGRRIDVEMWLYPDGSRIFEISTKCLPKESFQVAAEFRAHLARCGIEVTAVEETKTKRALEFFSADYRGDA